jgi:hypothetical protein
LAKRKKEKIRIEKKGQKEKIKKIIIIIINKVKKLSFLSLERWCTIFLTFGKF